MAADERGRRPELGAQPGAGRGRPLTRRAAPAPPCARYSSSFSWRPQLRRARNSSCHCGRRARRWWRWLWALIYWPRLTTGARETLARPTTTGDTRARLAGGLASWFVSIRITSYRITSPDFVGSRASTMRAARSGPPTGDSCDHDHAVPRADNSQLSASAPAPCKRAPLAGRPLAPATGRPRPWGPKLAARKYYQKQPRSTGPRGSTSLTIFKIALPIPLAPAGPQRAPARPHARRPARRNPLHSFRVAV